MLQQKLINITIAIANNLQEKWQQNNITTETLMQLSFSIWDLMLAFFNQVFIFYNVINTHFKLTHTIFALFMQLLSALETFSNYIIDSFYNCDWQLDVVAKNLIVVIVDFVKVLYYQIPSMDEIQQKWSQMNEQYQITDVVVALFTQSVSVLENIYEYLIRAFNDSDWIFVVARNQMVALTDTTIVILRKLETVLECLIDLFNYILPLEKRGDQIPDWLYLGVYFAILFVLLIVCIRNLWSLISMFIASIVKFMVWCLGVKTMKAPGKPNMMISRNAFEANPKKYFANHRRKR